MEDAVEDLVGQTDSHCLFCIGCSPFVSTIATIEMHHFATIEVLADSPTEVSVSIYPMDAR